MYAAVNTTTWAVLALKAIGETGSDFTGAVAWLKQQQGADGGFPSEPGDADDIDDTAAAIQALRAGGLGTGSQVVTDALAYLHARQRADGGFPDYPSDGRSYAESTAWVIQALIATGQDPQSWNKGSHTPVDVPAQLAGVFGGFPAPARPVGDGAAHDLRGGHRPVRQEVPLRVHRVRLQAAVQAAVHLGVAEARHGAAQYAVRAGAGLYADNPGGTGIDTGKISVLVDTHARRGSAHITSRWLTLSLSGLPTVPTRSSCACPTGPATSPHSRAP